MDAKDILGLPKNSFPSSQEKKPRAPKESQRKPDGVSREVYALTGGNLPPLMPTIDVSHFKRRPQNPDVKEKVETYCLSSLRNWYLGSQLFHRWGFRSLITCRSHGSGFPLLPLLELTICSFITGYAIKLVCGLREVAITSYNLHFCALLFYRWGL